MHDSLKTILYGAVFGIVCALLLTGVREWTKPRRELNERVDRQRNVMQVLGIEMDAAAAPADVDARFRAAVRETENDGLLLYEYQPQGEARPLAYALSVRGVGLWGPVEGLLALEPDLQTIRDISFYKHEETPGLGGRIEEEEFRAQFRGKRILGDNGAPGLRIVTGGRAAAANEVDAISGATITSSKVQDMLNRTISDLAQRRQPHGDRSL